MPTTVNKKLLGDIGAAAAGALLLLILSLALAGNCLRLHYANLRLGGEAQKLRQDPLLRKYPSAPPLPETFDTETFRALAEKYGLDFVSSQQGDTETALVFTGEYAAFLNYLRALAAENCGEISQIALGQNQKIIIKGEKS